MSMELVNSTTNDPFIHERSTWNTGNKCLRTTTKSRPVHNATLFFVFLFYGIRLVILRHAPTRSTSRGSAITTSAATCKPCDPAQELGHVKLSQLGLEFARALCTKVGGENEEFGIERRFIRVLDWW